MSEKIKPSHIERDAYVYIRQSSMQQLSLMKTWVAPERAQ